MKRTVFLGFTFSMIFACANPMMDIENELPLTQAVSTESIQNERYETICYIEPMAEFPGGVKAWENHLKQYLQQPEESPIQGKVFISFVVLSSGKLTDISIIRGITEAADKAALEVLRKSPDWIPVTLNGKPAHSRMTVMVRYGLNH